jgi:hypothetical protein
MYLLFKRPVALLLFVARTFVLAARGIVPMRSYQIGKASEGAFSPFHHFLIVLRKR